MAFKNISVHHDETDESDKIGELLGTSFQAKWFTGLSNNMLSDISFALRKQGTRFDPIAIIQSISDLLKKESEAQGKPLNDCFYESLTDLERGPDFIQLLNEFNEGINNERNIMTIGMFQILLLMALSIGKTFTIPYVI